MVVYAVKTEHSGDIEYWLKETTKRSEDQSMLKNPFKMRFKKFKKKKGLILVFDVKPLYPNFTPFGFVIAFGVLCIFGPVFWVWPGLVLGMLGYFWSSEFFLFMTKLGIRRAGYKGVFKRIRLRALIEEVMF